MSHFLLPLLRQTEGGVFNNYYFSLTDITQQFSINQILSTFPDLLDFPYTRKQARHTSILFYRPKAKVLLLLKNNKS